MRTHNILVNLAMTLSVEDQISSIETQYNKAYDMIYNIYSAYYSSEVKKYRNSEYLSKAIKAALALQRSIELLFEDIKKLSDETTKSYIDRCQRMVGLIVLYLRGSSKLTGTCDGLDIADYETAFKKFKRIRSWMYQILEDIRLIYSLRIYPIEEKIALKSQLSDYGFVEVVKCLDEAEDNLAMRKPEHFKDCIDRCREALEKTAASILVAENKKPSGYFSTDIGTVSNLGIVDKESKRLTEATYSYLSEVGAHGRAGEVTLGDAHYAMKETYMRIDILLKKYATYLAGKEKS